MGAVGIAPAHEQSLSAIGVTEAARNAVGAETAEQAIRPPRKVLLHDLDPLLSRNAVTAHKQWREIFSRCFMGKAGILAKLT